MWDGQKRRQEYGTERGDIKVGVLVMGIKGTKREKDNRGRQECGTGGGNIKVGVLMIGIKGTKWGNATRKSRDVEQGVRTLKVGCFSDRNKRDEVGEKQ